MKKNQRLEITEYHIFQNHGANLEFLSTFKENWRDLIIKLIKKCDELTLKSLVSKFSIPNSVIKELTNKEEKVIKLLELT